MDNLTFGSLQRMTDSPPKFKQWLILAHPDDFDRIAGDMNRIGLFVVPYGEVDDGWRYRIVTYFEAFEIVSIHEDYLMLSSFVKPGQSLLADLNKFNQILDLQKPRLTETEFKKLYYNQWVKPEE